MVDVTKHAQFLWLLYPVWFVSSSGRYETGKSASRTKGPSNNRVITSKTGSDVILVCPNLTDHVEWRKNGRRVIAREGVRSLDGSVLVLRDVSRHDAGHYRCSGSWTFVLDIVSKEEKEARGPEIKPGSFVNTHADEGGTVTFECKVKSRYLYSLHWYRGKHERLKPSSLIQEKQQGRKRQKASWESGQDKLTLSNLTITDTDWYSCVVKSRAGLAQQSAWLEVKPTQLAQSSLILEYTSSSASTVRDAEAMTVSQQTADDETHKGKRLTGVYLRGMVYAVALSAVVVIVGLASFMAVGIYKARRRQDVVLQPYNLK